MKREEPLVNNYEEYKKEREESKDQSQKVQVFTTMQFTPDGEELLIGKTNGFILVMDPNTGSYKKLSMPLKTTENK